MMEHLVEMVIVITLVSTSAGLLAGWALGYFYGRDKEAARNRRR